MQNSDDEIYKRKAEICKAIANPVRIKILEILKNAPKCVSEIQHLVGGDISSISKHLKIMKSAGLLLTERRHKQVFYRLRVLCILDFFYCIEEVLTADMRESIALVKQCRFLPKQQFPKMADFANEAQAENCCSTKPNQNKKSEKRKGN